MSGKIIGMITLKKSVMKILTNNTFNFENVFSSHFACQQKMGKEVNLSIWWNMYRQTSY